MIKNKKLLIRIILLIFAIMSMPIITKAVYTPDKTLTTMNPGDVIYFDTTGLSDWQNVYIYIWQGSSGDPYKNWDNADGMTKIGDTNIYSYTVPSEVQANKYDMLIFKNGTGGQTIDLGFIENKYAYIVESWGTGKGEGYWYLYDKSLINEKIAEIEKIKENEEYYTPTSYGNLNNLLQQAKNQINGEVKLKEEEDSNYNKTGKFYIDVDYTLTEIEDIIKNLVVNKEILQAKVNEEEQKMDTYKQTYMPNSLNTLEEKIDEAKQILQKDSVTVDEIKQAIKNIDDSKQKFVLKADKTELKQLLNNIENLDKSIYTDESVNNLNEATQNSQTICNNQNATQQEVDESVQKLQEAFDALEKKPADNNEEQNPDINDGDNNENENPDINDGENNENENENPGINDGDSNQNEDSDINDKENEKKDENLQIKDEEDNQDTKKENSKDETPDTGDNIMIYAIIFIIALIGLIITRKIRNKN